LSQPPGRGVVLLAGLVLLLGAGLVLGTLAAIAGGQVPLGIEFRQWDQLRIGADSASLAPAAHSVGQTFRSEHANLSTIAVQLKEFSGRLPATGRFHLQAGTDPLAPDILSLPLSAADFGDNPYLAFHFPPRPDSAGRQYRFRIETVAPLRTTLAAHLSPYDTYSAGTALIDDQAQPGDLAFRTYYTYTPADLAADAGRTLASQPGLILATLAFLLLPGRALAEALGPTWTPGERLLAAAGLTLLAWPVALLGGWGWGVGGWGPVLAWLAILAGAAVLLIRAVWHRTSPQPIATTLLPLSDTAPNPQPPTPNPPAQSKIDVVYWLALATVLGLTLLSRLATIRDLVAGMGLDAYHHTLVTALLLDRGGIPHDYQPYAPLASFTYHFGFHAFAAALAWLAPGALPVERLMPVVGQLATTLPVLTLALFGRRVLGNRWVGLLAGGLAGVVTVFPAFYVNWSRYTQGLGLALLPVAWVLLFEAVSPVVAWRPGRPPLRLPGYRSWLAAIGPGVLAALGAAGLFLTHYRIAGMFVSYAGLFLLGVGVDTWRQTPRGARVAALSTLVQSGLAVTAGAVALVLPWLLNLRANFTVRFAGSGEAANAPYYDLHTMLGDLTATSQLGYWSTPILLGLAGLGLLCCLGRRDWPPVLLAVWFGLHLLWSNPTLLSLPGAGYLDSVTVVTSSFIPLCLLAAYPPVLVGEWLVRTLPPRWGAYGARTVLAASGLLLALVGADRLLAILDVKPYVTAQDIAGLHWLRSNTAPSSFVAGNGFGQPWGPEAVQGSDAGVWVPLLAGRRSALPPIPAYNERLADPGYLRHAVQIVRETDNLMHAPDAPDAARSWAYLRGQGVTHLYIGSRGPAVLDPAVLLALPDQVQLVFHQDDVWIFALRPPPPSATAAPSH